MSSYDASVTAWAGPALVSRAFREERGQIYSAPEFLETTIRYDENDGVSTSQRVRYRHLFWPVIPAFPGPGGLHWHWQSEFE